MSKDNDDSDEEVNMFGEDKGIPIDYFLPKSSALKDRHPQIKKLMLICLGIDLDVK